MNEQNIKNMLEKLEVNGVPLGIQPFNYFDNLVDAVTKLDGNVTEASIIQLRDVKTGGYIGSGIFEMPDYYVSIHLETPDGNTRKLVAPVMPGADDIKFQSESRTRFKNLSQNNGYGELYDAAVAFADSPQNVFRLPAESCYNLLCTYKSVIDYNDRKNKEMINKINNGRDINKLKTYYLFSPESDLRNMFSLVEKGIIKNLDRINSYYLTHKQNGKHNLTYHTTLKQEIIRGIVKGDRDKAGDIFSKLAPDFAKEYGFYHKHDYQMENVYDLVMLHMYKVVSDDLIRGKVHQLSLYLGENDTEAKLQSIAKLIKESSPMKGKAMVRNLFQLSPGGLQPALVDKIYNVMKEEKINLKRIDPWFIRPLTAIYKNKDLSEQEKNELQDTYIKTALTGEAAAFYSNKLANDIYHADNKEVVKDIINTMEYNNETAFAMQIFSSAELEPVKMKQARDMIGFYGVSYISAHKDTIHQLMTENVINVEDIYTEPDVLLNACKLVERGIVSIDQLAEDAVKAEDAVEKNNNFTQYLYEYQSGIAKGISKLSELDSEVEEILKEQPEDTAEQYIDESHEQSEQMEEQSEEQIDIPSGTDDTVL